MLLVMQNAAWETARLRVRATSLAAENDALKGHVQQLMHQIGNMDKSVQVVDCFALRSHIMSWLVTTAPYLVCLLWYRSCAVIINFGFFCQLSFLFLSVL